MFSSYFVNEPVAIFEVDESIVTFQLPTFEQHVVLSRLSQLKNIRALVPDLDSPSPVFSLGDRSLEVEIAQRVVGPSSSVPHQAPVGNPSGVASRDALEP